MTDDWQDISTAPTDGSMIRLKFPNGEERVGLGLAGRLNFHERKTLAEEGEWPDYRKWTPTHWRPYVDDKIERDEIDRLRVTLRMAERLIERGSAVEALKYIRAALKEEP